MANRDHRVEVGQGDTVVLASSLIPGNENAVFRVINGLIRLGAAVVHSGNARVHVSGHASAGELLYCYNILRPRNVMPVHGEVRHLVANARLAELTGVPRERVVLADDGSVVDLVDGRARLVGQVPCGMVYVDGSSVGSITDADLKDRRVLGDEGFVSVFVVVDAASGKVVVGPEIHARGVAEEDEVFQSIRPKIADALADAIGKGAYDNHQLQQVVRRVMGRWAGTTLRRRPMIIPIVVET
jgi:ribonuclease J